jgi:response regulator RpfG family c-di-GMP phosphodiesterase
MSNKILCIDDDLNVLTGIQRNLRKHFEIDTAIGALAALKLIEKECPYAVIVADMQMPGMNGVEFLNIARQKYPDTVRVMLTGNADQKTATDAVNRGHIFQFLNKPCPPEKLAQVLTDGVKQYRLITAERELLENTLNGSVKLLTEILSLSDPAAFGRSQSIRDRAREVGKLLELPSHWELELAAMLAQLGYVSLPPIISQKLRSGLSLTGPEQDILQRVPQVSSDLLANIPRLQSVARIVLYQAKNLDGTGFPLDGVSGDAIPLAARILRVLQELAQQEAVKVSPFKALEQMRQQPAWYDSKVLEAVTRVVLPNTPTVAALPPRALTFAELHPGLTLASDICTTDNIMVISSGTKLTPFVMERLRNFASLSGLKEPIYVEA